MSVAPRSRILVVDDDDAMRRMLVDQIRAGGLDAEGAPSVDRALALLATESFAMVLSDVRMAPMDGFDLLERVRSRGRPPVVLMSAFPPPGTAERARQAGAADFLGKPFPPDELHQALVRVLGAEPT